MSKKKINPRAFKEIAKNQKTPVYRISGEAKSDQLEKTKHQIQPYVLKDLRNVIVLILITVVIISVFGYITYKTEVLSPLFDRFNLKY